MKKYIFSFVILHYNEAKITIECINKIFDNTVGEEVNIVIVDNHSPDGSGKNLQEKFSNNKFVTVILLKENLGFAKGNNVGYKYAKENLCSDFICILNNDAFLRQQDFIQRVIKVYEKGGYGVIGPHITLPNGKINYMYLQLLDKKEYEKELEKSVTMYRYYTSKLYPLRNCINQCVDKIGKNFWRKSKVDNEAIIIKESLLPHENIVLHGCCLIFTPSYLRVFRDAFNFRTFMFREEELLYIRCRNANVNTIYTPTIDILHLEDISTNAFYKKNRQREVFKWKCQIESLKILLEEL